MSYQNAYVETNRLETSAADPEKRSADCVITQFFIFKEEVHLGWDCFYKEKISIGSGENADLVLKGDEIADIHAVVSLKNNQIVVRSEDPKRSVRVNNQSVETAILGRFDYLDIGPYTIKIKILESKQPQPGQMAAKPEKVKQNPSAAHSGEATIDMEWIDPSGNESLTDSATPVDASFEKNETKELPDITDLQEPIIPEEKITSSEQKTEPKEADSFESNNNFLPPSEDSCEADQPKPKQKQTKIQKPAFGKQSDTVWKEDQKISASNEERPADVNGGDHFSEPDSLEVETFDSLSKDRNGKFRVVYQGEVSNFFTPQEVKENLRKILGVEERKISWIDSESKIVVKKELSHWDALKLCGLLEKAGAKVSIEKMEKPDAKVHRDQETPEIIADKKPQYHTVKGSHDHDAEEDEEEDLEARFTLKNMILKENETLSDRNQEIHLEVSKFKNNTIVDIFFLKPNNKYHIRSQGQKFLLAENDRKGVCFFYYSDHVWGTIQARATEAVKTDQLKRTENVYQKRKGIYKHPVANGDTATVTDGVFEYIIRPVYAEKSPEVPLPDQEEKIFHKYLIKSSIVHLFFLVFIGFFHSVKQPEPLPPETHFVKIDTSELSQIAKKKKPVPPPVVKPPKPEPKAVKKEVVKKVAKKTTTVASKKAAPTRKPVVSRSPKAGGGFGKGNISNRNINQTGLLSMLGDSVGIKPQTAMAAVTNLDAVPAVHSGKADFKVGGIVGKLGNARIEIPQSGVVSTKGSSQVLRSSGAGGVGTVAALEKGQTGQKQVQGMVSAQLTKAVGVQGGMSREAVKRVIDQHLDEISYCYETALIANPSIMGKVIFEWKILTSGKVGMVSIKSSSINSNEIHSCIKAAIKTWQFPEPKGSEVIVSYPFVFDIVGF